jgi:ferredoxin
MDWKTRLHGIIYSRWCYLYIGLGTGAHPLSRAYLRLARTWRRLTGAPPRPRPNAAPQPPGLEGTSHSHADGYHGKVISTATARRLVTINEPVRLPDLEQVIPYPKARALILEGEGALVALDCPCRLARADHCEPVDVCLIVGEPFASWVLESHPHHARPLTAPEAEAILEAEAARGHVHHAFFKDAMLGRFYAICNCCTCCCGAVQSQRHGVPMLASSGYLAQVDPALCLGCGACESSCLFGALSLPGFSAVVDGAACLGCGVCVRACPNEAISLHLAPERGLPLAW